MGLDELHLRVLATSSEDLVEKENAKKGEGCHVHLLNDTEGALVLKLLQRGRHWILVVCNGCSTVEPTSSLNVLGFSGSSIMQRRMFKPTYFAHSMLDAAFLRLSTRVCLFSLIAQ